MYKLRVFNTEDGFFDRFVTSIRNLPAMSSIRIKGRIIYEMS